MSDYEHLEDDQLIEIKRIKKRDLFLLKQQEAKYGTQNVPTSIINQIIDINIEINNIDDEIDNIENPYQHQEAFPEIASRSDSKSQIPVLWLIVGGFMMIIALFAFRNYYSCSGNEFCQVFSTTQGLRSWKTFGQVSIIDEGREQTTDSMKIQLISNAFAYQQMPTIAKQGEVYVMSVWCAAKIGSTCRIFLGNESEGFTLPKDGARVFSRAGTENWESMELTVTVQKDEQLTILLYGEGTEGSILFDNLIVKQKK